MIKEILKIEINENEIKLKIKYIDNFLYQNIINFEIKKLNNNEFSIKSFDELNDNYFKYENENELILNENELLYYLNNLEI